MGGKAIRKRRTNDMEVRKKRPRGFKKEAQGGSSEPPEPPICFSLKCAWPVRGFFATARAVKPPFLGRYGVLKDAAAHSITLECTQP